MKTLILADLHFKNNLFSKQVEVLDEIIENEKPDLIIIAGDVFDNKTKTENELVSKIVNWFEKHNRNQADFIVTTGNHDFPNDSKTDILNIIEPFAEIVRTRKEVTIENFGKVLLCGWNVFPEKDKEYELCIGHFDIDGLGVWRGNYQKTTRETFKNCKNTISGHIHEYATIKEFGSRITYLGTPYQMTKTESLIKYYAIIEDEKLKLDICPTKFGWNSFEVSNENMEWLEDVTEAEYFNRSIVVHISSDYEKQIEKLHGVRPSELRTKIREKFLNHGASNVRVSTNYLSNLQTKNEDGATEVDKNSGVRIGGIVPISDLIREKIKTTFGAERVDELFTKAFISEK